MEQFLSFLEPAVFFETQRDRMVHRGNWTRAAELNLLAPESCERPFRVLLTRLSTYEDTSLSITHHYLYALVSSLGFYPDRAFLPPGKDVALWAEFQIPWLVGIQSHIPGKDFGLIAFSNAVAQEMGNLLWFLRHSDFPLAARDRRERQDLPLVILGGANAPFSSLLWGYDSPLDGVFLGEDRSSIEAVFQTVAKGRAAHQTKEEILQQLAEVPGFLLPGAPYRVPVRPVRATLAPELLAAMPVALGDGNAGKAHLAISAGCAGFCSFCAESWTRKPYTEASYPTLAEAALMVKAGQGASRLDIHSFNFNMHGGLYPFLELVTPWFSGLGLKSQRFDSLAADPLLLELEKLFGKTWFTCGLEGISERLRRALNKNLDQDQLRRAFTVFARSGVRELKVFLIATGWEEEEDFQELGRLLTFLRALPTPTGRPLKVVFSVTPLVRFPHTPLEFEPAPNPKEIDRVARHILNIAKEHGFEGRIAASSEEAAACDLMLRPPTQAVYETWARTVLEGDFVFREEVPSWFLRQWKTRLEALGWTQERLEVAYGVEANRKAPWARVDTGVRRSFLETQYRRNRTFQELIPAGLVRKTSADQALVHRWTEAWKARSRAEIPCEFSVCLTNRAAVAGRDQTAAALARALMLENPELNQGYRGFRSSWWSAQTQPGFCILEGDDRLTLLFSPGAAAVLDQWGVESTAWSRVSHRFSPFGTLRPGVKPWGNAKATWSIEVISPWPLNGQKLLTARGLKHTLRKITSSHWVFDLPAQTLKKDWIRRLESHFVQGFWRHRFIPGEKWDWKVVLEEGFDYPPEGGASRVRMIATEGSLQPRSV